MTSTLPEAVSDTEDPLVVLRWASAEMPEHREEIEKACIEGEVAAVALTDPTPGSVELLQACGRMRRPVVIVSNNASETIQAYLARFDISDHVSAVVSRPFGRPDLMKPHPDSINRALSILGKSADRCVLIGDSLTDIEVAHATKVRSIGYAKHPRRGYELRAAGADAVVGTISELADALSDSPGNWDAFQEPHDRWTLITVPGIGVTQARHPGEIDRMTCDLIATWLDADPANVTLNWLSHRPTEADF